MRFFATTLLICGVVASSAQTPTVPHKIHFAGMTLTIKEDAREEIQKDVNLLTQSPKHFEIKAERARTYFPIIERIFAEERVPEDFKFLVLQESALVADAVSVSNAVGFWQFKDFTAREMGLRVDEQVDERMNIVSATRAAAQYIKKNNFMFNNWVYALQSYQMGAGGVRRSVGDEVNGSRHMDIDKSTYWYVKKFLAHKIAFQDAVESEPRITVKEYPVSQGGSLESISGSYAVDLAGVKEFNKWIRSAEIPADKTYTLILPSSMAAPEFSMLHPTVAPKKDPEPVAASSSEVLINDVPVLQARNGETLEALASRAGISVAQFLKYNELDESHQVNAGGYYFTAKKKQRTEQDFHKVKAGETLWSISQTYGVQLKKLKKFNHLTGDETLAEGSMVWLSATKPDVTTAEVQSSEEEEVLGLQEDIVMDWAVAVVERDMEISRPNEHLVKQGETLYSIARTYNVSVADLLAFNSLGSTDSIKPGQTLRLSAPPQPVQTTSKEETLHEIKASETLYSVARQYGVTIKELMDYNNKTDFSVSVGEKLKIPAR